MPVRLTPKIFHLSVSHRKFLANLVNYESANAGSFYVLVVYKSNHHCVFYKKYQRMHNRRLRLIFSVRQNVVGRLCISPTIVFLILSNQKARVRAIISRRTFLCIWNMYFHQQRCLYKISNQKIPHFRCYDNIQPPVCSYIYINYYIYIYIIISFIQL